MATKTTYSRFAGLVIEHTIDVPDTEPPAEAAKPKRKRAKIEESPSESSDENPTA